MKIAQIADSGIVKSIINPGYDRNLIFIHSILNIVISSILISFLGFRGIFIIPAIIIVYLSVKYEKFLLYLQLAVAPLVFYLSMGAHTIFIYFVTILILLSWTFKQIQNPHRKIETSRFLNLFFAAFIFFTILSDLQGGIIKEEFLTIMRFLIFIPYMVVLYDMLRIKDVLPVFIAASVPVLLASIQVLYKVITAKSLIEIFEVARMKLSGIYTNSNVLGGIIIAVLPLWIILGFSLEKRLYKNMAKITAISLAISVVIINARAAIVGFFVSLIMIMAYYKKLKYLVGVALLVGAVFLAKPILFEIASLSVGADRLDSGRFEIWSNSLNIISKNPILGVGVGDFRDEYKWYFTTAAERSYGYGLVFHAHNQILSKIAELGIPGIFIMFALYYFPLRRGWQAFKGAANKHDRDIIFGIYCGIVALFVRSLFEGRGILELGSIYPEIIFWVSVIFILKYFENNKIKLEQT